MRSAAERPAARARDSAVVDHDGGRRSCQAGACLTCSPYCRTWTFSSVTSPLGIMASRTGKNALMLSSVSTISITNGKFSDTSRIFVLCRRVEWPKPKRAAEDGCPGQLNLAGFEDDRLVKRAMLRLRDLADEDLQQHCIAREIHGIRLPQTASGQQPPKLWPGPNGRLFDAIPDLCLIQSPDCRWIDQLRPILGEPEVRRR